MTADPPPSQASSRVKLSEFCIQKCVKERRNVSSARVPVMVEATQRENNASII